MSQAAIQMLKRRWGLPDAATSESVEVVSFGTAVSVYHGRCAPR